jgi:hypothetical protein
MIGPLRRKFVSSLAQLQRITPRHLCSSLPSPDKPQEPENEDLKVLYKCDGSRNIRFVAAATGINFTVCLPLLPLLSGNSYRL